jgi:tetratricopeptide (TPR) repeat protein
MGRPPRKQRTKKSNRASTRPGATANPLEDAVNLYNEGITHHQQGNLTLAESAFRKAISIKPDFGEAHNNLGNVLKDQDKWKAAEKCYRRALQEFPNNPMLLSNIGNALHHQGKTREAMEMVENALDLDPRYAYAHNYLGNMCMTLGQHQQAIKHYQQALGLLPDAPGIASNLGAALCELTRYEEAVSVLHNTVKKHPRFFDAYPHLAEAALKLGATDDAIKVLQEAALLRPDDDAIYGMLAKACYTKSNYLDARVAASRAIKINPQVADYYYWLGRALHGMNLFDDAEAMLCKAIALQADNAGFHNSLGLNYRSKGNIQQSIDSFNRAVELDPGNVHAHTNLARTIKHDKYDEVMQAIESLLETGELQDEDRISLYNSLGKSFHDFGDYERAFKYTSKGNALRKRLSPYDLNKRRNTIRTILDVFTENYIRQHEGSGHEGCTPIFITGMSRSGKTTIEAILGRHTLVTAGGESEDFSQASNEILQGKTGDAYPEAARDVDSKLFQEIGIEYQRRLNERFGAATAVTNTNPANADFIGMIRMCLPDAKIILCRRGAKDNCMEIFRKDYTQGHLYSFDPDVLCEYFTLQTNFMEQWIRLFPRFIHVVQFEDLVRDPENETRALLQFCGLPWDEACLDTESLPSPEQVIGVWKNYEKHLKPMLDKLDS